MSYNFKILLSASVPSEKRSERYLENYTKVKNAQTQIEEAVIGLSRNIFQAGGKIVFGGHPSISPLVAMVATEFNINKEIENPKRNERNEKPISIFQSLAYKEVLTEQVTSLFNLGYSEITWTEAFPGEKYDPDIKGIPQCKKSLLNMRKQMISEDIDALVCIGGMDGVEDEFELFREMHPRKKIFILGSTGGASKILANRFSNSDLIKVIDENIAYRPDKEKMVDIKSEKFEIIPYSFITALIVAEVTRDKNGFDRRAF